MKIGIDASFLRKPGTGIGQVTVNFLQKLTEFSNGEKIEFFLYCEEEPSLDFSLPENFKIRSFLPKWWKRDDLIRKMLWERQVAREAAKDGCDVFLSLYQSATVFPASLITYHLSSAMRHVMVVHDVIPRLFPEYLGKWSQRMHWRAIEQGIRNADHIVAVSEHTKRDIVRELGVAEEKTSVAYPDAAPRFRESVSDEDVARVLKKYGLERGYIYHGGGLEVRKNAERLLRAYKSLCDKFQISNFKFQNNSQNLNFKIPKLVISGKIFDKKNKLATDVRGLVESLGLQEKVKLLGFVPDEDLPALYRAALFFAYPSLYEGFGLPVLEALCVGTPVLASETSSLPEVGGDATLYCDPKSVDDIAGKMERLISDEALRKELVSKSAEQVIRFDWGKFVEKILETMSS